MQYCRLDPTLQNERFQYKLFSLVFFCRVVMMKLQAKFQAFV